MWAGGRCCFRFEENLRRRETGEDKVCACVDRYVIYRVRKMPRKEIQVRIHNLDVKISGATVVSIQEVVFRQT